MPEIDSLADCILPEIDSLEDCILPGIDSLVDCILPEIDHLADCKLQGIIGYSSDMYVKVTVRIFSYEKVTVFCISV